MGCCHYYAPSAGGDTAFSIDISAITFGLGVLSELGDHARARGIERVALMTDKVLGGLEHVAPARQRAAPDRQGRGERPVPERARLLVRRAPPAAGPLDRPRLWPQK